MAVFGKLAYDEGATVGTLLAVRFTLAAALFWARARGAAARRASVRGARPRPRRRALGLALGACGYALQAGCYFAALERIDASLLSLLIYTFPAMVAAAAIALGRERVGLAPARRADRRLRRARARRRRRRRGRARPARRRARPDRGASPTAPTSSSARASPGGCARRCSPRSSARARRSRSRSARPLLGRPAARRADRRRLGLARRAGGDLDRRRDRAVLRRPRARGADERVDPRDRRAARDRAARVPRLQRDARASCQLGGGALVLAAARASHRRGWPTMIARSRWSPARPAAPGAASRSRSARPGSPSTDRAQHPRAALGDRPAGDDRGDRRAGDRGGRRAGSRCRPTTSTPRRSRRSSSASTHLDVLVNDIWGAEHLFELDTPVWEHDLDNGLRLLRLALDTHLITSHYALPKLRPGGLVVEMTDGTAEYNATHYRVNLFYDLAKTAIIRMAWGLAQELGDERDRGRADARLAALGDDARAPRRDRGQLARVARSRTSASPSRRASSAAPSPPWPPTRTSTAGPASRSPAASSRRSTASPTSTAPARTAGATWSRSRRRACPPTTPATAESRASAARTSRDRW